MRLEKCQVVSDRNFDLLFADISKFIATLGEDLALPIHQGDVRGRSEQLLGLGFPVVF
jgi:hypothetical protein